MDRLVGSRCQRRMVNFERRISVQFSQPDPDSSAGTGANRIGAIRLHRGDL
jgi:hypothetical protein